MVKRVKFKNDNDAVEIELPDGRTIDISYSDIEDESLPELDIGLPCDMVANCYAAHLKPARAVSKKTGHARLVRQIIIPIEQS